MTPDVNVLVAAFRGDHPHHSLAKTWLDGAIEAAESGHALRLNPMVVASFLRLVTSPRIFIEPTPTNEAVAFIDALLDAPGVSLAALGAEWPRLRALCLDKSLTGNDLPDAWLAASVIDTGDHLVTFDKDFRRLLPRNRLTLLTSR
jgi:uncharacterized protein